MSAPEFRTIEGDRIITDKGTVTAKNVVFAAHYPFINMPGYYFMRMHQERSYVLALQNAMQLEGMYLGIDKASGWSLRNAGELLLFGGANHRTGEKPERRKIPAAPRKVSRALAGQP